MLRLLPLLILLMPLAARAESPDLLLTGAICQSRDWVGHSKQCRLGDTVVVRFSNLDAWEKADPVAHDPSKLVLALDGHPLIATHANVAVAGTNALSFDLTAPEGDAAIVEASIQAWRAILRARHRTAVMALSVGIAGGPVFYGPVNLTFQIYPPYAVPVIAGVILFVLAVCWLAWKSNLIRAPGGGAGNPYSLGRTQMLWWFLLVTASYIYIWLVTDNTETLTSGVLILMGISTATGLGSAVLGGPAPAGAAPSVSQGFLKDLICDEDGLSFDRLQMVAWTGILGMVFVTKVLGDLSMPDFSVTLLSLMGISSGTYVSFKLPGQKS